MYNAQYLVKHSVYCRHNAQYLVNTVCTVCISEWPHTAHYPTPVHHCRGRTGTYPSPSLTLPWQDRYLPQPQSNPAVARVRIPEQLSHCSHSCSQLPANSRPCHCRTLPTPCVSDYTHVPLSLIHPITRLNLHLPSMAEPITELLLNVVCDAVR